MATMVETAQTPLRGGKEPTKDQLAWVGSDGDCPVSPDRALLICSDTGPPHTVGRASLDAGEQLRKGAKHEGHRRAEPRSRGQSIPATAWIANA